MPPLPAFESQLATTAPVLASMAEAVLPAASSLVLVSC
jgi:hypothetical protein